MCVKSEIQGGKYVPVTMQANSLVSACWPNPTTGTCACNAS